MIRWRFVLTRLIVIIAVLALLRWGLGPVASYVTVGGLETLTGAKVEIAKTRIGLFPPRVQYVDVHIADPRDGKEMRDAFRADTIDLVIDGDALLHRRWVARDGRITGLKIGARRETSGHIARLDDRDNGDDVPSMLSRLVGATTEKLTDQTNQIIGQLETVRRSKEIRTRWENEYEGLVVRARKLEAQIRTVRDQARGIENPLRDWPELERTLAQARDARNELMNVRQAIDALPEQLQADLALLDEAKQIDIAKVDRFVPGDLSNTSEFGIDMMAEAVRDQIQLVRSYLEGGRTLANYTIVAPESIRIRGVNHDLDSTERPNVMVRRCEIGGVMRADGNVYAMTGILENLTPTPEMLAEPTRARLRLEGSETVRVEYVRDRRQQTDVDLLTLHWPQMDAKTVRLGDDDDAGISIEGGQRELWVQVRTEGDKIEGRLVSKQTGVRMGLSVAPKFAESAAAASLRDSLAAVDRIEIDANFAGTWKDLDLRLNTNLGQILRRASQDAIDGQIRQSRQRLAAEVEKAHLEQTVALRQWLGSQQSAARSLLASADKSIEEMSQKVLDEVGNADAYLGRLRSAIRGRLK
jgi:uncharacterized protein (TIGR03545 family)